VQKRNDKVVAALFVGMAIYLVLLGFALRWAMTGKLF
jgi:hypothetical protein